MKLILTSVMFLFLLHSAIGSAQYTQKRISDQEFTKILNDYVFIADFGVKIPERPVSKHIFWKYPFKISRFYLPIEGDVAPEETPLTEGSGIEFYHLNKGRKLFLEGKYEAAKETWLSGRARYGVSGEADRRTDFFLGLVFVRLADQILKKGATWKNPNLIGWGANIGTFFSWALILKQQKPDPLVFKYAPKYFYNMSAVYFNFRKYAGAFDSARKGLDFLRRNGRKEYRPKLRQIIAESHIQNRSFLEAFQQFDVSLREGIDRRTAAQIFARVADIYFDLNNYQLAAENYALSAKIHNDINIINPPRLVLLGESLFWLGRFEEAKEVLHYALEFSVAENAIADLSDDYASFAALRLSDTYMATKDYKQARIEYFQVAHEYRNFDVGKIAKVRNLCLELPDFGRTVSADRNLKHGRDLLEASKSMSIPEPARELAWACKVLSYTERERTKEMVERVRKFSKKFPHSGRFLEMMVEPVRATQAKKLVEYFDAGDTYAAVEFFERTRNLLFKKPSLEVKQKLFLAYVDTMRSDDAAEFWDAAKTISDTDLTKIRKAVFLAEASQQNPSKWSQREKAHANSLESHVWTLVYSQMVTGNINRIKSLPTVALHMPWIFGLIKSWTKSDESMICKEMYPTLARMYDLELNGKTSINLRVELQKLVESQLPDLFRKDEICSISMLELEADLLRDQPEELTQLYLTRKDWPLVEEVAGMFWHAAEQARESGDQASARVLYEIIRDKAPKGSSKARFAAMRLDQDKTEIGKMWNR